MIQLDLYSVILSIVFVLVPYAFHFVVSEQVDGYHMTKLGYFIMQLVITLMSLYCAYMVITGKL